MKKMEIKTNNAYEAPECVITRFALEMSVMSPYGANADSMDVQGDDDDWN